MSDEDERYKKFIEERYRERYDGKVIAFGDCENPDYIPTIGVGYHNSMKMDIHSLSVLVADEIMTDDIAWDLYTSEGNSIDDGIMCSDSYGEGGDDDGDGDSDGEDGFGDD